MSVPRNPDCFLFPFWGNNITYALNITTIEKDKENKSQLIPNENLLRGTSEYEINKYFYNKIIHSLICKIPNQHYQKNKEWKL